MFIIYSVNCTFILNVSTLKKVRISLLKVNYCD